MAAAPCIGCGFEINPVTGELEVKGARVHRQNLPGTPMQWPYDGTIDTSFPVADITNTNGLNCDQVTGDLFAFPNSTGRTVRGESTLIGASSFGNVFTWGIDTGSFPGPNPWNDSGSPFGLSTYVETILLNPSAARPMIVEYAIQVGPTEAFIDEDVSFNTSFVGNIWDDPDPYPGDTTFGFAVPGYGSNATGDPLDHMVTDGANIRFLREGGSGPVLSVYLPPGATTHFRVAWRGAMAVGSATARAGQSFSVGGGFNTLMIASHV